MVDNKHRSEKYYEYRQSQQNRMWVQRADPDEKSRLVLETAWLDDCTYSFKVRKKWRKTWNYLWSFYCSNILNHT